METYYILRVRFSYSLQVHEYEFATLGEIEENLRSWPLMGHDVADARITDWSGDNPYEGKIYSTDEGWHNFRIQN